MHRTGFKLLLFFTAFSFSSTAQEKTVEKEVYYKQFIQEFFFTEAVYPQEKNELQFTFSNYYQSMHNLQFLMEYGFTDRLQAEIELSDLTSNEEGLSAEFGLLYNAISQEKLSVSLSAEAGFERESKEGFQTETNFEWGPKIIVSMPIGPLQIHSDLGLEISSGVDLGYNTGIIAPFGTVQGIIEVSGVFEEETNWLITPGLIWNGWGKSEVAIGMPLSFHSEDDLLNAVIRLTIEFGGDDE